MKRLKIGIITHNFPSSKDDRQNAGTFVFDLSKVLNNKAQIIVLSPGPQETIKLIRGIKTYFFEFKEKLGNLKIYNPYHILEFGKFFVNGKKSLKKFIYENRDLDFIISMWAFPSGFFANDILRSFGIPYAIYALGSDIYVYSKKPILKRMIKKYLTEAKFLVADSPDLRKRVEEISGKKTLFLPSASNFPVSYDMNQEPNNKITLTFIGRLEEVKGVDIFVKALFGLKDDIGKFNINFIGDGSLYEYVKTSLSYYSNIKLWGNLGASKIVEVLKNSDWLVIPSRSDSIPLVFSEGMKLSVPVIASDLPDLKYLVQKYQVGLLFKKEDKEDLTKTLKKASIKTPRYFQFKKNSKKAAKIFDLNYTSNKLIELINSNL